MDGDLKYFTSLTSNPKENSRKAITLIILVLLFGFAYAFFGVLIQENGIASSAMLIVLFILIKGVITDSDILYSGDPKKNKYVRAFQANLPTKYIIKTFDVEMPEAKRLWYYVFNKWESKDHKMHSNWKMSLERGFKCRMVYFIIISFRFMFWLSAIFTAIIFLINYLNLNSNITVLDEYFEKHNNYSAMITYILLCLIIYVTFLIINYPSRNKNRGCFLRFYEINELNIDWIKRNIKTKKDFYEYEKGFYNNNNS